jgi:hypothetical protein
VVTREVSDIPPEPVLTRSVLLVRLAGLWNFVVGVVFMIVRRLVLMANGQHGDGREAMGYSVSALLSLLVLLFIGVALQVAVLVRYVRHPAADAHLLRPGFSSFLWVMSAVPSLTIAHVLFGPGPEPHRVTIAIWGLSGVSCLLALGILGARLALGGAAARANCETALSEASR